MTGRKIESSELLENLKRFVAELPQDKRPKTNRELVRILRVRILELEANIAASKQIQKDEIEYLRRAIELAMSNPSATLADIHKDPQIKSLAAKLPNPKTRGK